MSQPQLPGKIEGLELSPVNDSTAQASEQPAPGVDRSNWPQSALQAEAVIRTAYGPRDVESQFTLRDLFVLVTVCAVISLPLSRLPRPIFAGLIGGLTVLLMFVQAFEPRHMLFRCGWWLLLGLYLITCAMAAAGW